MRSEEATARDIGGGGVGDQPEHRWWHDDLGLEQLAELPPSPHL